jgi:hypothetical protein
VLSAKVACWVFSQGRSPGHYRKDEHGQQCESQRRGRNGISIAPHAYEESRNGSSTQGDDKGKQEAHATLLSALDLVLAAQHGYACSPPYHILSTGVMQRATRLVEFDTTDQNTRGLLRCHRHSTCPRVGRGYQRPAGRGAPSLAGAPPRRYRSSNRVAASSLERSKTPSLV